MDVTDLFADPVPSKLMRAQELRKQAAELSAIFYMGERRDYQSAEWRRIVELECEADELDGTAARRKREDEARQAAHEARMALYHQYPPEVRAKQKQARIKEVIQNLDALNNWRHENLDPMYAYNAGTQGAR